MTPLVIGLCHIEKEAIVTNAVLYSSRFSPMKGNAIGNSRGSLVLGACVPPRRSICISFLEENSVTDFAVLPNSLDETMFREAFVHLGRTPSAEKHVHIGVAHGGPRT